MKKAPKSFEEGLERLQGILSRMQATDTPLAESVKLYAEAADLIQYCNQTLDAARLQIEVIDTRRGKSSGAEGKDDGH